MIIGSSALCNIAFKVWARQQDVIREWMIGLVLVWDLVVLVGLLYFSGGPFSPLGFEYLLYIALAAVILPGRWSWTFLGLSLASFVALFVDHIWLPLNSAPTNRAHIDHVRKSTC